MLECVGKVRLICRNMSEKSSLGFQTRRKSPATVRCWNMSKMSDMPVGNIFRQPNRLVLLHPMQLTEIGDGFF
jgi:hypothetical protein